MTNHPNRRGRGESGHVPSAEEIKEARGSMSQADAGALIYVNQARWSDYEKGKHRMHPASWELFLIKSDKDNASFISYDPDLIAALKNIASMSDCSGDKCIYDEAMTAIAKAEG